MTTIAAIHQAPGPVPGLYDVTMEDGSMREDVTLGQLVEMPERRRLAAESSQVLTRHSC